MLGFQGGVSIPLVKGGVKAPPAKRQCRAGPKAGARRGFTLMCLATTISALRLLRAWKRRHWIEYCFRTLKHLLATGACQVHSEDAYYGHLVLRLMGPFVLFYTSRVVCKGRLTMEEIIFSLKHSWRFVDCEALELKALSQGMDEKAA